ncbi:hypothetical protein [Micromonospora endolithica]|uniref:hypothetical protein n=1 Tax=Micromonospora endolithica TaxID=230091 RepID=UPI001315564A|nr:hypothetical protein [Micromonospora endolithica]
MDAAVVEALARNAVERRDRRQVADVPVNGLRPVFKRLLCQVRVSALEQELTFVWRT